MSQVGKCGCGPVFAGLSTFDLIQFHQPYTGDVDDEKIELIRRAAVELKDLCDAECDEASVHAFLRANFFMFANSLMMTEPDAVWSKAVLGPTYETDFVTYFDKSLGRYWLLIELEAPTRPLFTASGDPSRYLTHAIRQVTDWQAWIADNAAYARTFLTDIIDPIGVVVIGRRSMLSRENKRQLREMLRHSPLLEIMTYDRLIENALLTADINPWMGVRVRDGVDLIRNPPPPAEERLSRRTERALRVSSLSRFSFGSKQGLIDPNAEFLPADEDQSPFRRRPDS